MEASEEAIKKQVESCIFLLKEILKDELLGIYLYGSMLIGGLRKFSDIDLFAVSNRSTTFDEKKKLETALLKISGVYGVSRGLKPVELILVVKSDVNPWRYPPSFDYPTFDFLYGDWLRKDFKSGNIEPWPTKKMPNLALIITQVLLSHKTLYGPDPSNLLEDIPYKDFIQGTAAEVKFLMKEINRDTRNILLTLSRMWSTLETDSIKSKENAVNWAIEKLPETYKPVLENAKAILLNEKEENWEDLKDLIKPCAEFIVGKINEDLKEIKSSKKSRKISVS